MSGLDRADMKLKEFKNRDLYGDGGREMVENRLKKCIKYS